MAKSLAIWPIGRDDVGPETGRSRTTTRNPSRGGLLNLISAAVERCSGVDDVGALCCAVREAAKCEGRGTRDEGQRCVVGREEAGLYTPNRPSPYNSPTVSFCIQLYKNSIKVRLLRRAGQATGQAPPLPLAPPSLQFQSIVVTTYR